MAIWSEQQKDAVFKQRCAIDAALAESIATSLDVAAAVGNACEMQLLRLRCNAGMCYFKI